MKELLSGFCDGQILMHKASMKAWDLTIPMMISGSSGASGGGGGGGGAGGGGKNVS